MTTVMPLAVARLAVQARATINGYQQNIVGLTMSLQIASIEGEDN